MELLNLGTDVSRRNLAEECIWLARLIVSEDAYNPDGKVESRCMIKWRAWRLAGLAHCKRQYAAGRVGILPDDTPDQEMRAMPKLSWRRDDDFIALSSAAEVGDRVIRQDQTQFENRDWPHDGVSTGWPRPRNHEKCQQDCKYTPASPGPNSPK
jgi:hypothetical protein